MKREKNEFLGLLCNLYLIVLLVALPLYTGEGYWKLGDTKYVLFRNVSYLCLGCWLVMGIPGRIRAVREGTVCRRGGVSRGDLVLAKGLQTGFSVVDCAVAAYGICVLVSALCSSYGQLAWTGYNEWYMGAVSQMLFVGIYFFVSRQYDGAVYPLYLGEGAFFLVTVLGLLHRLGIDPLGLQTGWNNGDWEYNHMLSTLGNINWLCGFYSVALAWILTCFMGEKKHWRQALFYIAAVAAFVLLGIQGSQGGLLILGVGIVVCICLGWGQEVIMRKLALLLAGFFACMPLIDWLTKQRKETAAVAVDGDIFGYTVWYGWMIAALVCMVFYFVLKIGALRKIGRQEIGGQKISRRFEEFSNRSKEKLRRWKKQILIGLAIVGVAGMGIIVICALVSQKGAADMAGSGSNGVAGAVLDGAGSSGMGDAFGDAGSSGMGDAFGDVDSGNGSDAAKGGLFGIDDSFGSGRGFLWRIALEGFFQANWKDKMIGAGPDCYGEAVFNRLGAGTDVWKGEHWEGAIFTNAHNEILSQLINIGILGTVSYLAIFLAGLWRYCGSRSRSKRFGYVRWLGVLAITMYGAHSLVSFQQVLNAPLLFLTLGLCEYGMRCRR